MSQSTGTTPVLLRGHLRAKFGPRFDMAVKSPAEAISALCHQLPGFREYVSNASGFKILVGDTPIGVDDLGNPTGGKTIRIIPVVSGSDGDGGKFIMGAALIIASIYVPAGYAVAAEMMQSIGTAMALGGVAGLLASPPNPLSYEQDSRNPSYLFSGGANTTEQGVPVPVLIGRMRIPGVRYSIGINSDPWSGTELGGTGNVDGVPVSLDGHVTVLTYRGE